MTDGLTIGNFMKAFPVVLEEVMCFVWNKQEKNKVAPRRRARTTYKLTRNQCDLISDLWEAGTPHQ